MARNSTLGTVRSMVKAETGRSVSIGTQQDDEINQIIFDVQQWQASEFQWPFLKCRWTSVVGTRYNAFPTVDDVALSCTPSFESPVPEAYVKWNNIWQPVDYGIDEIPEFNYLDSDRNQVLDPIQRWQFSDETQFEIWPIPSTAQSFRFVGRRNLTELRSSVGPPPVWDDTKTLDLDDQLVALYSAAELVTRSPSANMSAQALIAKANARSLKVKALYPVRTQSCIIGRGASPDRKMLRVVPLVVVAPS